MADGERATGAPPDWRAELRDALALLGHRNVIAVVDAAYPLHAAGAGLRTVRADAPHLDVVRAVAEELARARHVRPRIVLDRELELVPEDDAPGITAHRRELLRVVGGAVELLPHADVLARLDETARRFHVLVLKTDLVLPYTSVFFWLECGYWSDAAEARLRAAETRGPA